MTRLNQIKKPTKLEKGSQKNIPSSTKVYNRTRTTSILGQYEGYLEYSRELPFQSGSEAALSISHVFIGIVERRGASKGIRWTGAGAKRKGARERYLDYEENKEERDGVRKFEK